MNHICTIAEPTNTPFNWSSRFYDLLTAGTFDNLDLETHKLLVQTLQELFANLCLTISDSNDTTLTACDADQPTCQMAKHLRQYIAEHLDKSTPDILPIQHLMPATAVATITQTLTDVAEKQVVPAIILEKLQPIALITAAVTAATQAHHAQPEMKREEKIIQSLPITPLVSAILTTPDIKSDPLPSIADVVQQVYPQLQPIAITQALQQIPALPLATIIAVPQQLHTQQQTSQASNPVVIDNRDNKTTPPRSATIIDMRPHLAQTNSSSTIPAAASLPSVSVDRLQPEITTTETAFAKNTTASTSLPIPAAVNDAPQTKMPQVEYVATETLTKAAAPIVEINHDAASTNRVTESKAKNTQPHQIASIIPSVATVAMQEKITAPTVGFTSTLTPLSGNSPPHSPAANNNVASSVRSNEESHILLKTPPAQLKNWDLSGPATAVLPQQPPSPRLPENIPLQTTPTPPPTAMPKRCCGDKICTHQKPTPAIVVDVTPTLQKPDHVHTTDCGHLDTQQHVHDSGCDHDANFTTADVIDDLNFFAEFLEKTGTEK